MNRIRRIIYLICGLLLFYGCVEKQNWPSGRWIDLTHDFSAETIYWPTAENFKLDTVFTGYTDKGYYYSAYNFSAAEHGGTHIDAPVHFAKGRKTVEEISLQQQIHYLAISKIEW